jgi:hypothetical protein
LWIRLLRGEGLRPRLKILCYVENVAEAKRVEVAFIASCKSRGIDLTNRSPGGDGPGIVWTDEMRKRSSEFFKAMWTPERRAEKSAKMKGRKLPPEHVANIVKSLTGVPHSEERKRKISESLKGSKLSEATKEKISKAGKGKKRSEEFCAKMRARATPEFRAAISARTKGRKMTEEQKQKIREAVKFTPEHRAKISEACRKAWRERSEDKKQKIFSNLAQYRAKNMAKLDGTE